MLQLSVLSSARIYLNQHKAKQHAGLLHACDQCEYKAKYKRDLKIHIESAHEGVVYSCDRRSYWGKDKSFLDKHIKRKINFLYLLYTELCTKM